MLGQDLYPATDLERELSRCLLGQLDPHPVRVEPLGTGDREQQRLPPGRSLLLEGLDREEDVVSLDGLAVVPARLGSQNELDPALVLRQLHGLREHPIEGRRLVPGACEQRVVDELGESDGGTPLADEGLQVVEGPGRREPEGSSLGSSWVYVLEVLEAARVLEVAKDRQAVAGLAGSCPAGGACEPQQAGQDDRTCASHHVTKDTGPDVVPDRLRIRVC